MRKVAQLQGKVLGSDGAVWCVAGSCVTLQMLTKTAPHWMMKTALPPMVLFLCDNHYIGMATILQLGQILGLLLGLLALQSSSYLP